MSRQRASKDPYEDFKDLLKKREAMDDSKDEKESDSGDDGPSGLEDPEEVSGSSWDPLVDEEEVDELDEEMSESNLEGSVGKPESVARSAFQNPEVIRRLANNRKFPFFRALMLETLIDSGFNSTANHRQLLLQGPKPRPLHQRIPEIGS
jgi:hypothetical protein